MFSTPILFIIFNRPETTQRVFARIREVKPRQLYIAADGPRPGNTEDINLCAQTREIVQQIDWDCDVRTDFMDENIGFSRRVKTALTWYFSQVEMGIVLEDDCMPARSFFKYCEIMLHEFRDNEQIDIIIGSNFCDKPISKNRDYFISDFSFIWGWASWARIFREINWEMTYAQEEIYKRLTEIFKDSAYVSYFSTIIKYHYKIRNCWDVELFVQHIMQNKKGIFPNVNLVSNIGNTGTHYENSADKLLNLPTYEIDFDKFDSRNGVEMSDKEIRYFINQFNNKANPLSIRDRLYLLKKRLTSKIR